MSNKKSKKIKIIINVILGLLLIGGGTILALYLCGYFDKKDISLKDDYFGFSKNSKIDTINAFNNVDSKSLNSQVTMFDVGQADSSLIQVSQSSNFKEDLTNDTFDILIDAGVDMSSKGDESKLQKRIQDKGVRDIDLLIMSHAHFDHNAGVDSLDQIITKNTFVLTNWDEYNLYHEDLSNTNKKVIQFLLDKNVTWMDSKTISNQDNNKVVTFGNDTNNYFLNSLGPQDDMDNKNQNDWSVINKFMFRNTSILFTGDATEKTIKKVNKKELNADILKSPHHGSAIEGSNSESLLKSVSPKEVWISTSRNDKYTLPDTTSLKRYKDILPNNDVSLIKGTQSFGKDETTIRNENPNKTEQEIQDILSKWKSLNDFINSNPTINNNNKGYGDIVKKV